MIVIGDKSLYQEIGQTIFNASPDGAVKLLMNASLVISDDGDVCTFEFDYIDREGNRTWFPFGSNIDTSKLRTLLTQLRQSYINEGQPAWTGCEFSVDILTGKFEIDLKYSPVE
jgi:hypothetical protein